MKKILFIEDEAALQKAFSEVLRRADYKVISALDGEIALRLAKSEKPDLILLDLILPKKHGFEVLKELKEDPELKEIPVVVLTNLEKMEEVEKALALGAKTYLVKTRYNIEEILEKVKQILSQ
jgi:two-component system alkaline phosphatase synthesis response regulator PhoP